ncbi:MAG: hypothetical protein JO113_09185 [Candidatus Eremiobacteraeota bacterium]|nr:hypothetical protein [Candidatus Eremiobacteraeota bacterium]
MQYAPTVNAVADHVGKPLSYQVLYGFGGPDGAYPEARLFDVKGTLYGTTAEGGAHDRGTVFSVTTTGTETVLHSFHANMGKDGRFPYAGLVGVNGTLYGTTVGGGANGAGTVFSITTAGKEKLLYSFAGGSDGATPYANLINVGGTLYGTTYYGGTYGNGTVYSITTGGTEKVLYSFGSASNDGANPKAGLIGVNGTLYGTTFCGGAYASGLCYVTMKGTGRGIGGTVFSITTSGTERVLHSFGNGTDGSLPAARLLVVGGTLYGTTSAGGAYGGGYGGGTVFSITTGGLETVLHNFGRGTDGAHPFAGLINVGNTLYGTTYSGGVKQGFDRHFGTVFSVTTGGAETVLHNFSGDFSGTDGANPMAGLIDVNGTLYGTTPLGGGHDLGTVFSISP